MSPPKNVSTKLKEKEIHSPLFAMSPLQSKKKRKKTETKQSFLLFHFQRAKTVE